jgi:hypothetical protein
MRRLALVALLLLSCGGEERWQAVVLEDGPIRCVCCGPSVAEVSDCLKACNTR